jgi:hypothetical protein
MTQKARVYRDCDDELWIDPGDGMLVSLTEGGLRELRKRWGVTDRPAAEEKFGPLAELTDGSELLPAGERWPLLRMVDGKSEDDCADVALRVAGRARDAADAILLLEACGLRAYPKGGPA